MSLCGVALINNYKNHLKVATNKKFFLGGVPSVMIHVQHFVLIVHSPLYFLHMSI